MNEIFKKAVEGYTHPNYQKNKDYAKLLSQLITGEDNDSLLKQFKRRVNDEYFKQIKEITTQITPAICKNLMDVAYKIPRSTSIAKSFSTQGETEPEKIESQLKEVVSKFWGNGSVDDFMSTVFIDKNYIDPNSFLVLEWEPFDEKLTKASPYPFLVSSEMAVDYKYINNILQYLIVKEYIDGLLRWTYYNKDGADILQEIPSEKVIEKDEEYFIIYGVKYSFKNKNPLTINKIEHFLIGDKIYINITPKPYNLTEIPAKQFGFKRNMNDVSVFDSPIHPAICYLKKTIKTTIELDLSMCLHAFPQKFQYDKACPNPKCKDGMLIEGDKKCPTCHGEGTMVHDTAMDIVKLKLPNGTIDPNQIIDLQRLIHYEYPPVEGIKFQDEYIRSLTVSCQRTIFNSEIYSKQEISDTATGKNISLQNVYDSLYPFSIHYSTIWEWIYNMIAEITDIKVKAVMSISKDFKFKTKDDYLTELKSAKDAGANPDIIKAIEDEIMRIDLEDQPAEFRKYLIKRELKPFQSLSDASKIALLATLPAKNYFKNLYLFFDEIIQQIELKETSFYLMERQKQIDTLKKYTDTFINEFIQAVEVPQNFQAVK